MPRPNKSEVVEKALARTEELQSESARLKAADLAPKAIATLEKLMLGKAITKGGDKPSPSVSLTAAKEILAQALGRPETRDPRIGDQGDRISITVLNLTNGERREVSIDSAISGFEPLQIPDDTRSKAQKAIDLATRVQEQAKS